MRQGKQILNRLQVRIVGLPFEYAMIDLVEKRERIGRGLSCTSRVDRVGCVVGARCRRRRRRQRVHCHRLAKTLAILRRLEEFTRQRVGLEREETARAVTYRLRIALRIARVVVVAYEIV